MCKMFTFAPLENTGVFEKPKYLQELETPNIIIIMTTKLAVYVEYAFSVFVLSVLIFEAIIILLR